MSYWKLQAEIYKLSAFQVSSRQLRSDSCIVMLTFSTTNWYGHNRSRETRSKKTAKSNRGDKVSKTKDWAHHSAWAWGARVERSATKTDKGKTRARNWGRRNSKSTKNSHQTGLQRPRGKWFQSFTVFFEAGPKYPFSKSKFQNNMKPRIKEYLQD